MLVVFFILAQHTNTNTYAIQHFPLDLSCLIAMCVGVLHDVVYYCSPHRMVDHIIIVCFRQLIIIAHYILEIIMFVIQIV